MTQSTSSSSRARRAARRAATILLTTSTVFGAGYAVRTGAQVLTMRAEATQPDDVAAATPVSVAPLTILPGFETQRRFLGQVEPAQTAELSFELGGRIVEILVDEGATVARGTALARLDTALIEAEQTRLQAARAALEAELTFAEASLSRRSALKDRGFSPTEQLDQARATRDALQARIAETDAAIAATRLRLEKSVLTAPFDGRIAARRVDTGTTVAAGQGVVQLMEDDRLVVRVGLPVWADPAALTDLTVSIAGRDLPAKVQTVRPDIDPVTRTRTLLLSVQSDGAPVLGQTAVLTVTRQVAMAGAWVPLRALREGTQGVWTVFTVDADNRVRPAAVELLHSEADRAFVRGSFPDGARLIQAGPHRVTPGQLVRVTGAG
ncbi:efflux RND transporter periplasmic adaptor subunit [Meridianimarinicoccus sp. MJW13]|uniref:efflux RND transporter periplasmic adaptor subunit n=1 Tax=Meridianimarinicoccus sp. MJW13 TaxID=2720031 RepID=UPI001866CB24|nr:efflux RND transporter periplasmic adaptor subunit [Fluviibacterium sp. MJW13]